MQPKLHKTARGCLAGVLGTWLTTALLSTGCKSPDSKGSADWVVPHRGATAAKPPPRLTSPIAPAPEPDHDRPTNAPAAPTKSLNQSLAELKAAPPAEPQKLFSFSAKDLEVKDALALFARDHELN